MKTKKLSLNNLKVESFVTALDSKQAVTVQGGANSAGGRVCINIIGQDGQTRNIHEINTVIILPTDPVNL